VQIVVGEGTAQKTFDIHKGLLSFYSDYFRSALNGNFSEALEGKITLSTEEVKVFEAFKDWLYTARLMPPGKPNWDDTTATSIIKLYVLADRRQVPLLANDCLDLLHKWMLAKWETIYKDLPFVYEHTFAGNGLRRFMIDGMAKPYQPDDWLDGPYLGVESLRDLAKALALYPKKVVQSEFGKWDMCQYHVHKEGERCERSTAEE